MDKKKEIVDDDSDEEEVKKTTEEVTADNLEDKKHDKHSFENIIKELEDEHNTIKDSNVHDILRKHDIDRKDE